MIKRRYTTMQNPTPPKPPGQTMLRVVSILMVVYAGILILPITIVFLFFFAIFGTVAFAIAYDTLIAAALGIFGVISAGKQARARIFIILGVAALSFRVVLAVLAAVLWAQFRGAEHIFLFIISLTSISPANLTLPVLCILYIIGGYKLKKAALEDDV